MGKIEIKGNPVVPEERCEQHGLMNTAICNKKPSTLVLLKAFLSGYLKFIESPHRQDTILKTLQYSLWLLSKFYRSSGQKREIPHRIAKSLLSLQDEVSWARYLYRFFGFPAAINDVYQTRNDWGKGSKSKRLGQVMAWTMVAYYPLDHLSYLLWKAPEIHWVPLTAPIRMKDGTSRCPNRDHGESSKGHSNQSSQLASKASAWSCRFWLIWLFLDTFRCTLALRDTEQSPERLKTLETAPGANNELERTEVLGKGVTLQPCTNETPTVRTEHLQIIRNLLYALPATHWSFPNWDAQPWLSSDLVNGLCFLESVVGLYQGFRNFQKI